MTFVKRWLPLILFVVAAYFVWTHFVAKRIG